MGIRDEQLKQIERADLSNFDSVTNTYHIPKYSKAIYEINKCYIIEIADQVVNNTTSVLAINWNQGRAPQEKYMKIFVSKVLGKNIYIDGLYIDPNTYVDKTTMWSGWLETDLIKQIAII